MEPISVPQDGRGDKQVTREKKIQAIWALAADYHSGMGTRGYRLQCACQRWLKRHGCWTVKHLSLPMDCNMRVLYTKLVRTYESKL